MEPLVRVPALPGRTFRVPPQFDALPRLAYNLWWTWHVEPRDLYRRIDRGAWARYRNPVQVLASPVDWTSLREDADFVVAYQEVTSQFDRYMSNGADHWFHRRHAEQLGGSIAYFCAEYGLVEAVGIYSGGLGVLAGDHMKSASDMALPMIGVGLMYRNGYFRQTIDADGHQEHAYPDYDLSRVPIQRVIGRDGDPLIVTVELPERELSVAVWLAQVGRVPVLLLDTDIVENGDDDRPITNILYVRGREMRLHQELVLGVGGVRAIRALGLDPTVWHLNEGHSAFLLAERARELVAAGATFESAVAAVRSSSVFTIHTPVSAGNERFDATLVRRVAGPLFDGDQRPGTGGVPIERLLELGRGVEGESDQFDMTALSLRLTVRANAVSKLHAQTANETWRPVVAEPILGITNGAHVPTWVGNPMRGLYERYLDADLDDLDGSTDTSRFWTRMDRIPAAELWEAHLRQKLDLTVFARRRLRNQFARHGEAPSVLGELDQTLDPTALTIGFARRFATYKRAGMIFSDIDRLARLLHDEKRPVQIVFAGKAHPADRPGQQVIADIFRQSRSTKLRGRVYILEDYDMRIAQFLVRGVDVWLNNPRRPLEASGTSGMKAAMNGILNCSILDGWWDEGWDGTNGWAIGGRETSDDEAAQDWADAMDLYRILEEEIAPLYYDRNGKGLPVGWLDRMRRAVATSIWQFSTTRMLHDYTEQMYLPAAGVVVAARATPEMITEAG